MDYQEFNALHRGCAAFLKRKIPAPTLGAGTDASAIHGRSGAQVALLQSPILPTVGSPYLNNRNFREPLLDKTHTCSSVVKTQPPSDDASVTSPLLKSTYSSVKSAAYITAAALPRFRWMCSSNSFGATAAQSCLKVAFVGWPRLRLHKIFRLPGAE